MKNVKAFLLCSVFLVSVITLHILLSFTNPTKQERRFNLSLTEQEINVVLQGLSELPLKTSQPVYGTIMQQAQAQLQPQQKPLPKADTTKPKKQ